MLNQLISHTPVYVWAILGFLILRGVIAMRTREFGVNKLFIIPVVMLVLSLQDIAAKFGLGGMALAAWCAAAAATLVLVWKRGAVRVTPGATSGRIVVRGSAWPLATMMAIFVTKYAASVAVAVQPLLRHDLLFTAFLCALYGVFNGYFLGRLANDFGTYQRFAAQPRPFAQAI